MTTNSMRILSPAIRISTLVVLGVALLASITNLCANDSAAEVAAGGIQLRKEARISMEKERLTISPHKVSVEYEFLNLTNQDITTEVAFPIPPYDFTPESVGGVRDFNNFHVWVEGEEIKFEISARAELKGTEYTQLLRQLGIEIESFARFPIPDYDVADSQIGKLSKSEQQNLIKLGLTDKDGFPQWSVSKTYHWTQRFPAKTTLRVKHEYEPAYGIEPFSLVDPLKNIPERCTDTSLEVSFRAQQTQPDVLPQLIHVSWVKYILTTANTWKTPIKDFELIIERPDRTGRRFEPKYLGTRVCWDGEVRPAESGRFAAKRANYAPSKELSVYWFEDYN